MGRKNSQSRASRSIGRLTLIMSQAMGTMKVMSWASDQGEFVIINQSDFDPMIHKEYIIEDLEKPKRAPKVMKQEAEKAE